MDYIRLEEIIERQCRPILDLLKSIDKRLEEMAQAQDTISDQIEYSQHRDGCKCGFCGKG